MSASVGGRGSDLFIFFISLSSLTESETVSGLEGATIILKYSRGRSGGRKRNKKGNEKHEQSVCD